MNELHLFAGAGGGILGGILLGHTCVCAVEIEPYCRKVLLQRQRDGILPKFPIWDDVRTFDGKPWQGKVDVVCGGFPCQDISIAGNGIGIKGTRSGLWHEMARIIGEIRPRFVLVENSPMLAFRGLGTVLGTLASMGYGCRYGVFSACSIGLPHTRERLFILAYPNGIETREVNGQMERRGRVLEPTQTIRDWKNLCQPSVLRKPDDVADRMGQLQSIGNGQVPAVVKLAWQTLMGHETPGD